MGRWASPVAAAVVSSLLAVGSAAAAPPVVWTRQIDGAGEDDGVFGVALDGQGTVYAAGSLGSEAPQGGPVAILRRYSRQGTLRWQRTYEGPEAKAYGRGVAVDGRGRPYLWVETTAPRGAEASLLAAYTAAGERRWSRYLEGVRAHAAAVGGGRVAVVGGRSTAGRGHDGWVGVYTLSGRRLWTRTYDGPAGDDDWALGVAVAGEGSVYVVGSVATTTSPWNEDVFLRRYGPRGAVVWTRVLADAANDFDYAKAAAVLGGALYVGGIVDGHEGGPAFGDAWLARVRTTTGSTVWTRRWGGGAGLNDDVAGVAVDEAGVVYALGTQVEPGIEGNANIFLRAYSGAGRLLWRTGYDGGADDQGTSVAAQGGLVAAGGYRWAGATSLDGWVRLYG